MKLDIDILDGTLEGDILKKCNELYESLEKKENDFCSTFGIHCKKNCGSCCKHFEPDVTASEALFMAYGILKEGKEEEILSYLKNYKGDRCPFYDDEKFCTEYPYRPLICRLFNASASNDRNGNPEFRTCKWSDDKKNLTESDFSKHQDVVITMEEFGEQMEELIPGENKTELLHEAVYKAIGKLLLILSLEEK